MCFVSKTGTATSVLSCNLTVPLIGRSALELNVFCVEMSSVIGRSALELNVFCVEMSSDLLLLNLANLSKLGEEMYSLNR
jgi:hypothetical protein